ncbi:class I SAM-dependent methyltransferase [Ornithinimicrobium pratense]|uniref:Class I SAM-dependent methyltransferase n=1 Tax=Ornithinimicrobium pratense TaxID=2593973 RepID=A0A5J6V871_9MICO|nr:class I SAM-dependent methyltransferase [Ornithinimicrobium pratense]QFG69544.1 class I SAM-dependent methyltransferase [Ornithinimicrobium pratense]
MPSPAPRRRFAPVGEITRGTTNPNRLRRVDRWIAAALRHELRAPAEPPVVIDLGYGASPVTVLELAQRLRAVREDIRVVGVEIDPERVARGLPYADPPRVDFVLGGFEVPLPAGSGGAPTVVRAFNVLRQYAEDDVPAAWARVVSRLAPGGALVEGTCDEPGRLAAWVDVRRGPDAAPAPRSLTLAWRLAGLNTPSVVAERLPKVLIHRNVPGERVHELMRALDDAWARNAPLASYGARQRFVATARDLRSAGWPVRGGPARWRFGELTLDWAAVAPHGLT